MALQRKEGRTGSRLNKKVEFLNWVIEFACGDANLVYYASPGEKQRRQYVLSASPVTLASGRIR